MQTFSLTVGARLAPDIELLAPLARGGTAELWQARREDGERLVVKCARHDVGVADLIRHEHACLAQLRHPHIVRTLGLRELDIGPVLCLEPCERGNLVSLLGAPPEHWVTAARDLATALITVHARGWVHGDLKPRNVLFAQDERVVLADFAAARRSGTRRSMQATPGPYRRPGAPDEAKPADDVYAYAVLLHELITGRWPAAGLAALTAHTSTTSILAPLASAVAKALGSPDLGSLRRFADVLESVRTQLAIG